MLRVMRLSASDLALKEDISSLYGFIRSLPISEQAKTMFARPELDGSSGYYNFYSDLTGGVTVLPFSNGQHFFDQNLQQQALNLFESRKQEILQAVEPHLKIDEQGNYIQNQAMTVKELLEHPQHLVVVDNKEPVIVPFYDNSFYQQEVAGRVVPPPPPPPAAAGGGFWRYLLPLLLLLLLLGALAYYFLKVYPWPFVDEAEETHKQQIAALEQTIADDKKALDEINNLLEKTNLRLELAEQTLKTKIADDKKTLQEINALLDKTNAALAPKPEPEPAPEPVVEPVVEPEPVPVVNEQPAPGATAAAQTKKLPKCSVIEKQGKMPQLVIASDGSGSMLETMGGKMRIQAAINAAQTLVDNVDKNVPIHLFGIQGCPIARDYGVFGGNNRAQLKRAINQIDPRHSPRPLYVLTPLVSALRGMAGAVDANTEAVGILISDGVDTCPGSKNIDLCSLARDIHAQKPLLKINVVLIGDEAASAKCVADITGGKVYRPSNASALVTDLKNAARSLVKVCVE